MVFPTKHRIKIAKSMSYPHAPSAACHPYVVLPGSYQYRKPSRAVFEIGLRFPSAFPNLPRAFAYL